MNSLPLAACVRGRLFITAAATVLGLAANGFAAVTTTQLEDAAAWPGTPIVSTTGAGNLQTDFNVEVTIPPLECNDTGGCNGAATHTFVPETSFLLDKFIIRLAGAPTTGELYLFPLPETWMGGSDADGYVNTSFSTSLLNGGAGLPFTFFGTATRTLMEFDLTGSDEVTLTAGTRYALDIRSTDDVDSMYWLRAGDGPFQNAYLPGSIYETTTTTQPGERYDVAGGGRRDGTLALYAPSAGIPGDYNDDGNVDAADYVLWRKDPASFGGDPDGYNTWRDNFGEPAGGGAGAGAIPEPAALVLAAIGACLVGLRRTGQ